MGCGLDNWIAVDDDLAPLGTTNEHSEFGVPAGDDNANWTTNLVLRI